ncbi:hypothetical protein N9174_03300 [bacterium]|nr:hypothetical protein [bacterium]
MLLIFRSVAIYPDQNTEMIAMLSRFGPGFFTAHASAFLIRIISSKGCDYAPVGPGYAPVRPGEAARIVCRLTAFGKQRQGPFSELNPASQGYAVINPASQGYAVINIIVSIVNI